MDGSEKEIFLIKLKNRSSEELDWMRGLIETELKIRKFDSLIDREFRVCDNCGFTWPESVNYCRCNSNKMMRREYIVVMKGR